VWDIDGTKLMNGRELVSMKMDLDDKEVAGLADGIRCDKDGNIWAGIVRVGEGYDGVRAFSPEGRRIGRIPLPEICANVCFGGPRRNRLFMTATRSLYAVHTEAIGAHWCRWNQGDVDTDHAFRVLWKARYDRPYWYDLLPQAFSMNQIDLQNRIAIVTGGARGIGRAIAERLLASGARVSLWDVDAVALAQASSEMGTPDNVHTATVDLADLASVQAATAATVAAFGKIDILVNNAGITGGNAKTWELDPADWRRVMEINLNGPFYCCHSVVPHLITNGYGRIVNIASIAGKEGNPNAAHYSASKAAVIALTKSLGKELATANITVNAITPAVIATDILQQMQQSHIDYMLSKIPMGRFGKKEEAAALVAWLCSEDCSFTTAAVFDLSGGRATY
jgi:3-oxoacyl-[acyl-carrier protein] reductase